MKLRAKILNLFRTKLSSIKMPVEAGKIYYITMHIKPRFIETEIFLEEITYNTAAPMIARYKLDECD